MVKTGGPGFGSQMQPLLLLMVGLEISSRQHPEHRSQDRSPCAFSFQTHVEHLLGAGHNIWGAGMGNVGSHWAYRTGIGQREEKEVRQSRGMGQWRKASLGPQKQEEAEWRF